MSENGKPDVWQRLNQTLPHDCISQRQGAGGRMLDYIDRPVVWERLDMVVAGEWDFRLGEPGKSGNTEEPIAIKGTLTVLGVTREDIGQGKDVKEAATDAFKRCAVQFGIGRQLYAKHQSGANGTAGAARPAAPPPSRTEEALARVPKPTGEDARCPKCGGPCYDNRAENDQRLREGKKLRPDWKCRDRTCDGVLWRQKETAAGNSHIGPLTPDEPPFPDDSDGSLPF